jgi:hypothetical protein
LMTRSVIPWCVAVLLIVAAVLPLHLSSAQASGDSTFSQVWQRTDRPVAEGLVSRTWVLGPAGFFTATESYGDKPGLSRQVEYYDKSRLEINDPNGASDSPWFITSGLLVKEMISGQMQIGDDRFQPYVPAAIPVAGDPAPANALAPTYASLQAVATLSEDDHQAKDMTGQPLTATIDASGRVGENLDLGRYTLVAIYNTAGAHNIPAVFWDFLNSSGLVYEGGNYRSDLVVDWLSTTGLPLTEAYWAKVKVGGKEKDVLIQAFERRVLTYTPDNPAGWQVEMGNVGRHYYSWRYQSGVLTGQVVRQGDWEISVDRVSKDKTLIGGRYLGTKTAEGVFVTVFATIKNLGSKEAILPDTRLVDSNNRTYPIDGMSSLYAAHHFQSKSGYIETISPGVNTPVVLGFDIDPKSTGLRLRFVDFEQPAISLGI